MRETRFAFFNWRFDLTGWRGFAMTDGAGLLLVAFTVVRGDDAYERART